MGTTRSFRQTHVGRFIALGLLLMLVAASAPSRAAAGDAAKIGYPSSMAATGDSITRAYNTGPNAFADAPNNSWSTGINGTVNSHYSRILAANSLISGEIFNDAVTGAVMANLNGQVATANSQGVEYVTILMGANDACTSSESTMTPVSTFREQFQTAMSTLSSGSPDARIYVISIPNIYNLWSILKDNPSARFAWSVYRICQSMLANPTSTKRTDVQRRERVKQRVVDFNTQLAEVCAQYIHCRFDNNAAFNTAFVPGDVSTRDYFHPSIAGQAKLASTSYGAGYNFTDNSAPTSSAATAPVDGGLSVELSASDDVGVAGTEYRLDTGAWIRYTDPVTVPGGSTITYRAVDVNGNIEGSQAFTTP